MILYIIIYLIGVLLGLFLIGYMNSSADGLPMVLFWPIILPLSIVILCGFGIFGGMVELGRRARTRYKKKELHDVEEPKDLKEFMGNMKDQ